MRLYLSVLVLAAAAGLATLSGFGRGYPWFLALVLVFLLLAALPERHWPRLWSAVLWLSVACAVPAVVQAIFVNRPGGPFASPNFLGAVAAICLFLAWREQHKPAIVANVVALTLSQSRGAIIATGCGVLVLLARRRPVLGIAAVVAAVAVAAALHPGIEQARLGLWRVGAIGALQRPLLGWGFGGLWVWPGLWHFYSIPLDWLIATGIIGLAAGAWMLAEAWRAADDPMRAALAAWFVQGLFLSAIPATSALFFAMLAFIASERSTNQMLMWPSPTRLSSGDLTP